MQYSNSTLAKFSLDFIKIIEIALIDKFNLLIKTNN